MQGFNIHKIIGLVSIGLSALWLTPAAQASDSDMAAALKGTWVGSSEGYDGDKATAGFEKIVVSEVKGRSALGTWQYRTKTDEPWSAPIRATFTLFPNDASGWVVAGSDSNGVYTGELSAEGDLTLAYMHGIGRSVMTLQFQLTKQ
jgi:hypothetical protein